MASQADPAFISEKYGIVKTTDICIQWKGDGRRVRLEVLKDMNEGRFHLMAYMQEEVELSMQHGKASSQRGDNYRTIWVKFPEFMAVYSDTIDAVLSAAYSWLGANREKL